MRGNWSDFEKHVIHSLERIEKRLTLVEVRTAIIAATVVLIAKLIGVH